MNTNTTYTTRQVIRLKWESKRCFVVTFCRIISEEWNNLAGTYLVINQVEGKAMKRLLFCRFQEVRKNSLMCKVFHINEEVNR